MVEALVAMEHLRNRTYSSLVTLVSHLAKLTGPSSYTSFRIEGQAILADPKPHVARTQPINRLFIGRYRYDPNPSRTY